MNWTWDWDDLLLFLAGLVFLYGVTEFASRF
jgi:hypothetical protein